MKRILGFALSGLLLFVFFIAYQLPATYITSRLPADIVLQGVQGTIWQGEAALLTVNTRPIGRLGWQWHLGSLFSGQWGYQLAVAGEGVTGETLAAVGFDQQLRLSELTMDVQGRYVSALFQSGRNMHLTGHFQVTSPLLRIRQGWPADGSAFIVWQDAGLQGDLPMSLGELAAKINVVDDQLLADINDNGGPLELKGNASINAQRAYQIDLTLRARADADDNLRMSLKLISAPDLTGRYRFSQNGRL